MHTAYDTLLRSLDAATGVADDDHRRRAEAGLARIVATPDRAVRARPRRGWIALAAAATVAAIAIVALVARGPDDSGVAYASWTPVPSLVAAHDLDLAVRACRDQLDRGEIPLVLAERRGDFVALLFHENNPDLAGACVAWMRPGSDHIDRVDSGSGGSSGPAWTPAAGRITQGMIADYGEHTPAAFTEGAVGRGVVGVRIHAGARTITATVANGRYAAWWPGRAVGGDPLRPILTYDVRLADGTVKRDVTPAVPR
jgi:hypothetical protein